MTRFIGRKKELQKLLEISQRNTASFVVVRGRRRIGKSRLIEEFGKNFDHFYSFVGLAPEAGITAKHQLDEFSRQISREFKTPPALYEDWSDALWAVGEKIQKGKILLLFDEVPWMASLDPTFLAKIKNFWDQYAKKNENLFFVLCGSASSWIEKNILSSTGFVGRITQTLTLEELLLEECAQFWPSTISSHEILKALSITGGIPRYLEEINPKVSAEENIKRLCFTKGALLVQEFDQIFSDLFSRRSIFYKKIVEALVSGSKERQEIAKIIDLEGGRTSEYLSELELAGFIKRENTWNIKVGRDSKQSKYRLSDNYLRFYLKYIEKNKSKIDRNLFDLKSLSQLPEWNTIMGLQFENLVLNNRHIIHQALGLDINDIISENPFYQRPTKTTEGCQIDFMIETRFCTLYVCEIKFSRNEIDPSIIQEVGEKIKRLKYPRGYSIRPVLIHVNGVHEDVINSNYFASIIDISRSLKN